MQQNILSFLHLKTKSQCSILDQKGVFEHQNRYPNSISIKTGHFDPNFNGHSGHCQVGSKTVFAEF